MAMLRALNMLAAWRLMVRAFDGDARKIAAAIFR